LAFCTKKDNTKKGKNIRIKRQMVKSISLSAQETFLLEGKPAVIFTGNEFSKNQGVLQRYCKKIYLQNLNEFYEKIKIKTKVNIKFK
jgi:hypothetical protein